MACHPRQNLQHCQFHVVGLGGRREEISAGVRNNQSMSNYLVAARNQEEGSSWGRSSANSLFYLAKERPLKAADAGYGGRRPSRSPSSHTFYSRHDQLLPWPSQEMSVSNYPLMDTLNSAMFRLSMEDLVIKKVLFCAVNSPSPARPSQPARTVEGEFTVQRYQILCSVLEQKQGKNPAYNIW